MTQLDIAPGAEGRDGMSGLIKIAILAVGGQGGGVLTNWIVDLARRGGYRAQATSVAGVAQRTGSTIYYIEMAPAAGGDIARLPVFALSPAPGDVDIVIAAEMMEAGRAIMRGFVTPDRTTLIASTHRVLATVEKVVPGDGRVASGPVLEQARKASHRAICLDLEAAAEKAGSVISASLFGALAGSGALPFGRSLYEDTIAASGRGVGPSLAAFAAGHDGAAGQGAGAGEAAGTDTRTGPDAAAGSGRGDGDEAARDARQGTVRGESMATGGGAGESATPTAAGEAGGHAAGARPPVAGTGDAAVAAGGTGIGGAPSRDPVAPVPILGAAQPVEEPGAPAEPSGRARDLAAWRGLCDRLAGMPQPVRAMARRGLSKVVDYQDIAYGREYLDLLARALAVDRSDEGWAFGTEAAKHLANAMCYDDLIRVADLKTRATRDTRLRREQGVQDGQIVQVTEYFHPRAAEVCGVLPARAGAWIETRPRVFAWLDRRVNKGRRLRTDTLRGWLSLWLVAGLRPVRRRLLRHRVEQAHLRGWLDLALREAARDHALGVEVLRCRRLIKGYADTHARGLSKYARVIGALEMLRERDDAADWLARLRQAALRDENGDELDGALRTVASFTAAAR